MPSRLPAGFLFALLLGSPARADDVLRYLPSDTKGVLTIRPPQLGEDEKKKGAEVVRRLYLSQLAPELKKPGQVPISDVTSVVIAQPFAGTLGGVMVLSGKIDAKLMDRQLRGVAKENDE